MNSRWATRGGQGSRLETARRKRILAERDFRDAQGLAHVGPAPAHDMESFGGGGEAVGALVGCVSLGRPLRELVARVDRALQSHFEITKRLTELRFERCDAIPAEHEFGRVMQEFAERIAWSK